MYLLGVLINLLYFIYVCIKKRDISNSFKNREEEIAITFKIKKHILYICTLIISLLPIIIYRIMI